MKSQYIQRLIAGGENQRVDFKFEISDSRKIARTFVAFANADGGKLLIGVKDNGTIAGIRAEEEKYMANNAVNLYCSPPVEFTSHEWTIEGKKVLEIKIPSGINKPYMVENEDGKWRAYIRVNDKNILANKIIVNAWKRKYGDRGTYINYSDNEKFLLEYLESHEFITFSGLKKMTGISRFEAENILINFLALDIIEAEIDEKQILYRLSKEFRDDSLDKEGQ